MNILTDRLPESVEVDGKEYAVHTDFRNWIQFEIVFSGDRMDESKFMKMLELCYIDLPPSLGGAVQSMFWFYTGGDNGEKKNAPESEKKRQIYSFEFDADYIYAAFLTQYKIDLQTADLHWWQFKSLFKSLDNNNKICKIMEYRAVDLSQIKDKEQKKFYRKMKALYRLPDLRSEEEKEKAMIESMSSLF